jgi:hypothetical protein
MNPGLYKQLKTARYFSPDKVLLFYQYIETCIDLCFRIIINRVSILYYKKK